VGKSRGQETARRVRNTSQVNSGAIAKCVRRQFELLHTVRLVQYIFAYKRDCLIRHLHLLIGVDSFSNDTVHFVEAEHVDDH
jgi:hypothetical protein